MTQSKRVANSYVDVGNIFRGKEKNSPKTNLKKKKERKKKRKEKKK